MDKYLNITKFVYMKGTINKKYHFYAAHRNQYLKGKCQNLHGHTYYLTVGLCFKNEDLTSEGVFIPFEEIDKVIDKIVTELDHSTFVDHQDKDLMSAAYDYPKVFGKLVYFKGGTSVENLCKLVFSKIKEYSPLLSQHVNQISIQETTSSEVILKIK